jgi:predicted phage-related endonuclease
MRRGRIMEPGVAVAVGEEKPEWRIVKADHYLRDTEARIGATPDYYIHGPQGVGILEAKSVAPDQFETQWANGAPRVYILQTLTQMMLADVQYGVIACLVDNRAKDLFMYDVPRHPKAEQLIRDKVAAFWESVKAGEMPKPDYSRDAAAIAEMFPNETGEIIDLSSDNRIRELLEDRATLKTELDAGLEKMKAIDAEIKHKIGDASEAGLPGWRITFKMQKRKAYEVSATEFRVLRITDLTKKEKAA